MISSVFSPSQKRKNDANKKNNVDEKKRKLETNSESLHKKLKEFDKKNYKKDEISIWIEMSHDFRREKIASTSEPFIHLYKDFNYLTDAQNVR